jgi:hypothetical protein
MTRGDFGEGDVTYARCVIYVDVIMYERSQRRCERSCMQIHVVESRKIRTDFNDLTIDDKPAPSPS